MQPIMLKVILKHRRPRAIVISNQAFQEFPGCQPVLVLLIENGLDCRQKLGTKTGIVLLPEELDQAQARSLRPFATGHIGNGNQWLNNVLLSILKFIR